MCLGALASIPAIPYKPQENVAELIKAAEGIMMIHDKSIEASEGLAQAKRAMKDAGNVIILGFGYDEKSVKRLGLSTPIPDRTIFGSS
jgi:hypothetical protein